VKILLFGAEGQVGRELRRAAWPPGCRLAAFDLADFDITKHDDVLAVTTRERPDIVINAAAYTAVDRAESEPDLAFAANRDGPALLAEACQSASIPLIHLSTDYVYGGEKEGPYREDDPINPLGIYGKSKAGGDEAVAARLSEHVILRTAWVYSAHGTNFVKTMLRLAAERPSLKVVADQIGSPTSAADIAAAIIAITARISAGKGCWGLFHFTGAGAVSWYGFAEALLHLAVPWRGPPPGIVAITTAEYPTPARRPANSALDCSKIVEAYGIVPRPWREALADVIAELLAA